MPTAIPMISTTSDVPWPIGSQRLGIASSETVVVTAVPARITGMLAAMRAPKTSSKSTKVSGTEVSSALWKSRPSIAVAARSTLAPPVSETIRSGYRDWTAATASSALTTRVSAWLCGPATWNVTSALRPPGPIMCRPAGPNGDWMSVAAPGSARSAATTA